MKVLDVMQKNVEYVSMDTPLVDVARIIFEKHIRGVPVCKGKKLAGFITSRDVLSQFYPESLRRGKPVSTTPNFEDMEKRAPQVFDLLAKNIMSKNPVTITADKPLLQAQSLMFIKKIGRLPVVDKSGNLIGLISKADIFKALVGDKLALAENAEYNDWYVKYFSFTLDWKRRLQFEISDIVRVFDQHHAQRIIDVGCAAGDHAIALSKKGFEVTGIERSTFQIQEANQKRSTLPKDLQKKLFFLYAEYEKTFPALKNEFDAALFTGNALAHNPYNYERVLQNTAQKLKKEALIILQLRNMERMLKDEKKSVVVRIRPTRIGYSQQRMLVDFYKQSPEEADTFTRTSALFDFDGKKWAFHSLKSTKLAYITKEIIERILTTNGFKTIEYYGATSQWDYLFKNPFDKENSDWLNVVALRR